MKIFPSIFIVFFVCACLCSKVTWSPLQVSGDLPTPRSQHTAVLKTSTKEMIIFGGLHLYNSLDDTYVLNLGSNVWSKLDTSGMNPPQIRKHTAVLSEDEKNMIVFGGVDDFGKLYGDIYSLDLETHKWSIESTSGTAPPPRLGHTAVSIPGNKMIVFGGNTDRSMLNDLFVYDITKKSWTKLNPSGELPVARTGTIGTHIGNYIYIFGGIKYYGDIYGYLNDAYRLNLETTKWEKINTQGKMDPRASFCAITSASGNYLLLHGYWQLFQDDTVYLDSKTQTWTQLDDSDSHELPLGRSHASAVTLNEGDRTTVYLFAGNDGIMGPELGYRNSVWKIEGSGF